MRGARRPPPLSWLTAGRPEPLGPSVVVVSPHCDDAVLSLGAVLAAHVRAGGRAVVLTVFAGDPRSRLPAGPWDAAAGFRTQGEAAAARRTEDDRACRLLGVEARRLDEGDEQYAGARSEAELWRRLRPLVDDCDELLLPGFPLAQDDHHWVTQLVLRSVAPGRTVRFYVEQPYGLRARQQSAADTPGSLTWGSPALTLRDVVRKARAVRCYRSQLPLLGPGRLPSPSRLGAVAVQVQLWRGARRLGEWITSPLPAGGVPALRHGAARTSPT